MLLVKPAFFSSLVSAKALPRFFLAFVLILFPAAGPTAAQIDPFGVPKKIHLGDLIDVDIVGSVEYDWRGTLTPEGFLDGLDQIADQIYAKCRSEEEVAAEIAKEYSRILRDPVVVVKILDTSNRAVTRLNGAVRTPHRFRVQRPVNLVELIVLAGGLTDSASGEIRIQRPDGVSCGELSPAEGNRTGPDVRIVKVSDLLRGDQAANPRILSGDIVTVLEAYPIYVIGGVGVPGAIDAREKVTLTRAIARAGGFADKADRDNITIYRRSRGKAEIINVDLKAIEEEAAPDTELLPFDIVDVPQKGGAPRRFPPDIDSLGRRFPAGGNPPLKIVD